MLCRYSSIKKKSKQEKILRFNFYSVNTTGKTRQPQLHTALKETRIPLVHNVVNYFKFG